MELIKQTKGKCELCKATPDYAIAINRLGIKSRLNVCASCLKELYKVIGEGITPKSIETIKKGSSKNYGG